MSTKPTTNYQVKQTSNGQHGRARLDEAYGKAAPSLLANRERHLSSRRRLSSLDDTYHLRNKFDIRTEVSESH
ncbi:hypothetical protein OUZ56_014246 [Daphnia magna]|uniref:Uncharacterized protein n=1 Tax=Daphnia magna TaxID=35525 RepID=A0ABQ9Z888_9CRUS|nr:hypothetical protein OUZ56_014246 [Daphnia magna]